MNIRASRQEDLPEIMKLYEEARQFMRENGNPGQWGSVYPQRELILEDIEAGNHYICEEDGRILGTFYFAQEEDPDYREIYEGSWIGTGPYGVMHRVAAPGRKKGVASFCVRWCVEKSGGDLRIDTHEDNLPMQGMLKKNGFVRCGIIHPQYGGDRIAFEKIVKNPDFCGKNG
ncbi:MAG: GNAT family N-acetyltransferase [Eubacteriales bacterium]|nr:GNAT family N-acetyltransferase [Eubacteriales bacterium]